MGWGRGRSPNSRCSPILPPATPIKRRMIGGRSAESRLNLRGPQGDQVGSGHKTITYRRTSKCPFDPDPKRGIPVKNHRGAKIFPKFLRNFSAPTRVQARRPCPKRVLGGMQDNNPLFSGVIRFLGPPPGHDLVIHKTPPV